MYSECGGWSKQRITSSFNVSGMSAFKISSRDMTARTTCMHLSRREYTAHTYAYAVNVNVNVSIYIAHCFIHASFIKIYERTKHQPAQ